MERTRRELLRDILEDDRRAFIYSLAGQNLKPTDCRQARQHAYFEARRDYDDMKIQGTLPMFCRVFENAISSKHARLKGDISSDPVYSFLKEIEKDIDRIAMSQYTRSEDLEDGQEEPADIWDQDPDVYLDSKQSFLNNLIVSMECRAGINEVVCDWSDSAKINSESRYNYFAGLAKLAGEERTEAINELVKEFPSYPWGVFHWPKE